MVWLISAGVFAIAAAAAFLVTRAWLRRRAARRARHRAAYAAEVAADAMRLYQTAQQMTGELPGWRPGTPLAEPKPGAMMYFANRMHDHRPGRKCPYCNWPKAG